MSAYEKLLEEFSQYIIIDDAANLPFKVKDFYTNEHKSNIILLNKNLKTTAERTCILAEEIGHYCTTAGDILDQSKIQNRKQEYKARRWAVKKLIRVEQFIDAFNAGVTNKAELAEFLEVTEDFIDTTLDHFKAIYGISHSIGEYIIFFIYKHL
ncbi:ImmA/IrrE family metallo-endopeptidase [Lutispora thermophila]|uniref:IrrE N-terminal-like domain-containing protein n=1 Tax=Lutispora thermophila DSM 19022 TaxID=1122184 RepID=A0A1M6CQF9_9FIRM|nr:ImmA/IrrE family metallo-endopeptidase [Lutispora thermophila]SHI63216.1 protein of unknown function [Lutispora thermophila DSM 19022]